MTSNVAMLKYAAYNPQTDNAEPRWSEFQPVEGGRMSIRLFDGNVLMERVVFSMHKGYAMFCGHTGVLGFATGQIVGQGDDKFEPPLRTPVAIKFDGKQFIRTDTGNVITCCDRLFLTLKGAYAEFASVPVSLPVQSHDEVLATM